MTGRDALWRGAGAATFAGAIGTCALPGIGVAVQLLCFVLAVAGIVLMIQGRRVPAALRIELSAHRSLPQAIHARTRRDAAGATRPRR